MQSLIEPAVLPCDSLQMLPSGRFTHCHQGIGMCVSLKHRLVILSCAYDAQLQVRSLDDGSLVRRIGSKSNGSGRGQFLFRSGGLCISPSGDTVLLAELLIECSCKKQTKLEIERKKHTRTNK